MIIVDAYWDGEGRALCPAAVGISHHIGPGGDLEICPPIQFAVERVDKNTDFRRMFLESEFLSGFRTLACSSSRGCIIMEDPEALCDFMERTGAIDTTGRNNGLAELKRMEVHGSQDMPGKEIPDKSRIYRFAKKYWFFGFGAYG
jgi:hypothetical protein